MLLGGELFIYDAALRLTDALNDDLLCSLSRDAAELLRLDRHGDNVAHLGTAAVLLCGFENNFVAGILDLFDDGLVDVHLKALLLLVKDDLNIILALGIVLAEGCKHGLLDLLVHIAAGNALFFFDILDCFKKFSVHFILSIQTLYVLY